MSKIRAFFRNLLGSSEKDKIRDKILSEEIQISNYYIIEFNTFKL